MLTTVRTVDYSAHMKSKEETKARKGNPNWAKGKSGNPKGRPKKELCVPDILRSIGEQAVSDKDKRDKLLAVCEKAYEQALEGDKDARRFIVERMEGKALQQMDISTNAAMTISEVVVDAKRKD